MNCVYGGSGGRVLEEDPDAHAEGGKSSLTSGLSICTMTG